MKSNQQRMKKLIQEQSESITDEELFLSSAYQTYQSNLAKTATQRYRAGLQVIMSWDTSEDADIAYTDNYKIHMNAANPLTQSFPSRYLRSQSLTGLTGHETGHLIYSDFTTLSMYLASLGNGNFYPEAPAFTKGIYTSQLAEIAEALEEKDKATCLTLTKCAAQFVNITEDVYIESRMCETFPGVFRQGILLNNLRFSEQIPSIQDQLDKKYNDFSIVTNLIIHYCKTGSINNLSGYRGPYLDYLEECIPYLEDALYADDGKERYMAANYILVILWEYIKPLVEKTKEMLEKESDSAALESLEKLLESEISDGQPLPGGKNGGLPKNAPASCKGGNSSQMQAPGSQPRKAGMAEIQEVIQEEGNRIALAKTTNILDENNPGITYNQQYTGSGYEKSADDLFDILTGIASEKAEEQYQQEMTEELQKAADDVRYGDAHTGIHVTINRISQVSDNLISGYQTIARPLLAASRRLQGSIAPLLKSEAEGGRQKNLLLGKRLDTHALHRQDGTIFMRTRLPSDDGKLAVGLLVDESGSMSCENRITHARKTAIVLYDFCKSLDIPITIYGHSTSGSGVELYSYAEFNSVDTSDRYRLMDMSARSGNRDGAALRFVAEHLDKRPEKQKLLILISDGQPADCGYYGTEAEADLRGIKKEYEKKNIVLFAAAIGSDKENIKRIYKEGYLDITNLEDLPKHMTQLVKQYLK